MIRFVVTIFCGIVILMFCWSCANVREETKIEQVQSYIAALNQSNYNKIVSFFGDSIHLDELDYKSAFSKKAYRDLFQWDSVFQPSYQILDIQLKNDSVFARISKEGKRIRFLNEAPSVTQEVFTFTSNKIDRIAITSYDHFNHKKWDSNRTTLVNWVAAHHPELNGFLYDQSISGASRFAAAIDMYQKKRNTSSVPSLIVLGTVQDAGSPHIACQRNCCKDLFKNPDPNRKVVSLGLIDPENQKKYLFEATPDIATQLKALKKYSTTLTSELPDGIFVTHAHIGHYTGLQYLGKEATNAKDVAVYAMPKMRRFLKQNGPWSQLVSDHNIVLQNLSSRTPVQLTSNLSVIPFTVPHRDEFSETVGYTIVGPNKKVLFIPDIDKWKKWDKSIIEAIAEVDYAYIDATFFNGEELNTRDISQIPHPFVIESMNLFADIPASEKNKIYFIHFNHTNPLLQQSNPQIQQVINNGFHIAQINETIEL